MPDARPSDPPGDAVLWDVVEEHLDEAEFLFEQFERAFDSPVLTLADLARGVEARLLAHVDGLRVGGAPVHARLLEPLLGEPDAKQAARLTVAALVAAEEGRLAGLGLALGHADPAVRAAVVRACGLASGRGVDRWVLDRVGRTQSADEREALLTVVARRGLEPPPLLPWLQDDSAPVVKAAAEAARRADPPRHLPVMEALLEHGDEGVREAALVTALGWASRGAWIACERWALDAGRPRALPMALYAALAGPAAHEGLARQVARPGHRRAAIGALGFSGATGALPLLLECLDDEDPLVAKLAAQAISTIAGVDLNDAAFARASDEDPGAESALPPLEDDDLEADLAPPPEEALPQPNAVAIRQFVERWLAEAAAGTRYLGGQPFGAGVLLGWLERAPLGRRHTLGLALGLQSRGAGPAWLDTRAFVAEQRARLGGASAPGLRLA